MRNGVVGDEVTLARGAGCFNCQSEFRWRNICNDVFSLFHRAGSSKLQTHEQDNNNLPTKNQHQLTCLSWQPIKTSECIRWNGLVVPSSGVHFISWCRWPSWQHITMEIENILAPQNKGVKRTSREVRGVFDHVLGHVRLTPKKK